MKKFIFALVFAAIIGFASVAGAVGVSVNGSPLKFTQSDGIPFIENGRTLVPLRAAAEAYGIDVSYDAVRRRAILKSDSLKVEVPIGESCIYLGGEQILTDTAAKIVDSRTYLPIRVVMEAFGAEVGWDEKAQNVTVDNPDVLFVSSIENGPSVGPAKLWPLWNSAVAAQNSGNYAEAVELYKKAAPSFLKEGATNSALLFEHLAQCYAKLSQFHTAAVCFERSAEYWGRVSGQEQTSLHCTALKNAVDTSVRLYLKSSDPNYCRTRLFGAPLEPKNGIILGFTYNSFIPDGLDANHRIELQYFSYGEDLRRYDDYFKSLRKDNKILELAWEPRSGYDSVQCDSYLIEQASYLESTGCSIMLRFANEMNDETNPWYTADYNMYIEKFRTVASVFKQYAPSVAIVWAPNFYPQSTIDLYYPGDEYVDYVGLSVYEEYNPSLDPLGEGIERSRWSSVLDYIYSRYSDRKPIIMAEGGCSYRNIYTGEDITDFAAAQMLDFYTYLPIKYPNVKMAVLFNSADANGIRRFKLADNPRLLDAYAKGIASSECYKSGGGSDFCCELFQNSALPAKEVSLCSYITTPVYDFDYVAYTINGTTTAAYAIPYEARLDLSPYAGQTIELRVCAFKADGTVRADKTFKINVI